MQDEAGSWVASTQEGHRARLCAKEVILYLLEAVRLTLDALEWAAAAPGAVVSIVSL